MKKIMCIKLSFFVYGQEWFCYCENQEDKLIWAEGAISELSTTAYISSTTITAVTQDDFDEHHYSKIETFTRNANKYEHE